ncbi:RibD family protein [Marinobacter orientalis]|uniref:RibD family protein n=1 Tax=Marinobacter orientalis TaxID=1928859 RepID=A0A7Y0RCS0_9GAMM|nr:RibD family protein [Marinobacter orientalis]NMT63830.1 RibD family protein [Marinobacter orientalis]TGX49933.1 RibD family protein [Marinobacter orientalis]
MAAQILDKNTAWTLILEAVNRSNVTLRLPGSDTPALELGSDGDWRLVIPAEAEARSLLSVFLPLCCPLSKEAPSRVVGQMGQSLDGRIATVTGASKFINGDDGITHLHRLRAVSEAVVVGAGTAATDNPRLTVRKAPGANPVRVVIDRNRRVPQGHHLFSDEASPTLRLVAGDYQAGSRLTPRYGVTEVPCLGGETTTEPADILAVLADFGLRKIFVEGGGLTVSEFLSAGLLDRLHVMVAPMIIGSGRPAFSLPEISHLGSALRPRAQMVDLGSDMLFDLDFSHHADDH